MFEGIKKLAKKKLCPESNFEHRNTVILVLFTMDSANYLQELTSFLYDIKWIFCVNTKFVENSVINKNRKFIECLNQIDMNFFPELSSPQKDHPECLQVRVLSSLHKNFYETLDSG